MLNITRIIPIRNIRFISYIKYKKQYNIISSTSFLKSSLKSYSSFSWKIALLDSSNSRLCIKKREKTICSKSDTFAFEQIADETLEDLLENLEEIILGETLFSDSDIILSGGVLTLKLGPEFGTYVINKQTPNKQIWFSSPISGPKRYDFINNTWIYKHDGISLHDRLSRELSDICKKSIDLTHCSYGS